jgi:hypothetical protein
MKAYTAVMSKRAILCYLQIERERCILSIEKALQEENANELQKWFDILRSVNANIQACDKL